MMCDDQLSAGKQALSNESQPEQDGQVTDQVSFEAALAELETVVRRLESGEASLAQSMDLFKRGTELSAYCEKKLSEAETTVNQLLEGADGTLVEKPFSLPE